VIASISGIEVGDAASVAPLAAAVAIRPRRTISSPPQPMPSVAQDARSQSWPSRTKSSIVRPRNTPKTIEATALSVSRSADEAVNGSRVDV